MQLRDKTVESMRSFIKGAPKLGYMYPCGCICLSEEVHLRLAIERKNLFIYY